MVGSIGGQFKGWCACFCTVTIPAPAVLPLSEPCPTQLQVSELKETLRQALLAAGKPGSSKTSSSSDSAARADVTLMFNSDLVAARVAVEGLQRRVDMSAEDKRRADATLGEAQARMCS